MEFQLIKDKSELEGTAYFEFAPGEYNGKYWNDNSIYLSEDALCLIEDVFEKNLRNYNHFSFTEMDKNELCIIIKELEKLKIHFNNNMPINGSTFSDKYYVELNKEAKKEKLIVVKIIVELIQWIKSTLKHNDKISLLGI
jgi:hypothetical protein